MENQIKLITWDIEGTLFSIEELKSSKADEIVRGNCLQLVREEPKLVIIQGVEEVMVSAKELGIYQGICSGFNYQFAVNYLAASMARDYIDPRLIVLANKYAWEGHVLDKKDWNEVLKPYLKPSPLMLNIARKALEEIIRKSVSPSECIHVGDKDTDRESASNAGFTFYHISNIARFLGDLNEN